MDIRIGCAGWAIATPLAALFPGEGTHLARYARVFDTVEINSSFYRPHRRATYERWAASVPPYFRFTVKVPREITHTRRFVDCAAPLARFLDECGGLGEKLGALLVQLPPGFAYAPEAAAGFFAGLRARFDGAVVCEPRHPTWFSRAAWDQLDGFSVSRVAADPAPVPEAATPRGRLAYYRLHGSPRMYWSEYPPAVLSDLAGLLASPAYVIFDNTAAGFAIPNALALREMVTSAVGARRKSG